MKKISILIGLIFPFIALAADAPAGGGGQVSGILGGTGDPGGMWKSICTTLPFCGAKSDLMSKIGDAASSTLLPVLAAAAIASIAYAGVKMVQSNGDESGFTDAKKIIMTAIIGSFIALSSIGIMMFLYGLLEKTNNTGN